ncbi:MAG: hypothetical protein R3F59_29915 [Myxococcota bacterium]
MDGVPTLRVRVGNQRGNNIVDAQLRIVLVRTERLPEGNTFYRLLDLKLARSQAPALARSLMMLHPIDADSPLFGATPESLADDEIELMVTVSGTDDLSLLPVHAGHNYADGAIAWGHQHADVLTEQDDGTLVLDVAKFNVIEPTQPTPTFPYPR